MSTTTGAVTPAEADLPQHHLGRRPRPRAPRPVAAASSRRRCATAGPRTVQEKVRARVQRRRADARAATTRTAIGATCGSSTTSSLPTGLLHAAAGVPPEEQENLPAVYEDFRPGTYDQDARLADMDAQPRRSVDLLPEHVPALRGPGLRRARRQGPRARRAADLQRLDDRRVVRRRRRAAASSRSRSCRCGTPSSPPHEVRRCAAKGSYAIAFSENPAKLGYPSLLHAASGTRCGTRAWRPTPRCRCTSARRRRCRPRRADAPLAVSMSLNCQNAQGSVCDWVCSRTLERFPTLKLAYAESQVGWMPFLLERMDARVARGRRRRRAARAAVHVRERPRVRLHLRRPARAAQPRRGRHGADPVRVRLPARRTARGRTRAPVAHRLCSRRGHGRRRSATSSCAATRSSAYGLDRFGISRP